MIEDLRRFIRHPSDIPIRFRLGQQGHTRAARDISQDGLCFTSDQPLQIGENILVEITSCKPGFSAEGVVRWCRREGEKYLIGVGFTDSAVRYAMRMVEQICHIEAYRRQLESKTGQKLSSEQAAMRWIAENAASFPPVE